jgi:hypothetical protein
MLLPHRLLNNLVLPDDLARRLGFGGSGEFGQVLVHEVQSLLRVIVSVEEDAGIGGMVEFGVEVAKVLET